MHIKEAFNKSLIHNNNNIFYTKKAFALLITKIAL